MKYTLIRQISHLALILALAGTASAQTESDYDAFGITDDNIPLDQLVPQDDTLPPPQTFLSDGPEAEADTALGAESPAPQADSAPVAAQDSTPEQPQIARFTAPADWVSYEIKGITFSAPPDWSVVKESRDELFLFGGDMKTHAGPSFAVRYDRKNLLDDDEMEILSVSEHLLADSSLYNRVVVHGEMDGGKIQLDAVAFQSLETNEDDDYLSFTTATFNDDYSTYGETFEQVLGTVKTPAVGPQTRPEALDGLVSYKAPKSWVIHNSVDGEFVSLRTKYYAGYIAIAFAGRVIGDLGMDGSVPADATAPQAANIFGQEAMLQTWESSPEFYIGARMVSGRYSYYRLNKCLPDGAPIGIVLAGPPEFFEGEEFSEAMAGIALSLPEGMQDCAELSDRTNEVAPQPAEQQAPAAVETPTPAPQQNIAQGGNAGQMLDVEGVQFNLPQDWTAINDSPSDKIFTSPDGRFTVLAFWWFPDEPITNYDDISVKQVVNDHEPSTRITSQIGNLTTILNVTERARTDENRFIFTVEGSNVSLDELTALHDTLVPSLRFNNVFNPEAALDASSESANPAPAPAPATQSSQSAAVWESYLNTRFGTQVSYPSHMFREMDAPQNNDGRSFEGINGSQSFLVFGQHNINGLGVRDLIEQDLSWGGYDEVTYKKMGEGWYVLSGFKGHNIFYRKVLVDAQNELFHVLEITYPSAQKEKFDSVVTKMAASFAMATEVSPPRPGAAVENTTRPQTTPGNRDEIEAVKK